MKTVSWNNFVTWVFYGVVAFMANRATGILDKLENSINDLNIKLAVVVMKTEGYEKRLDRQDDRLLYLESKAAAAQGSR